MSLPFGVCARKTPLCLAMFLHILSLSINSSFSVNPLPSTKNNNMQVSHCLPTLNGYRDVPGSSFSTKKRVHNFFQDHINNGRWFFITLNWHECMVFPVSTHIRKLRLRHAISKLLKFMRYRDVYIFKIFKFVVISRRAVYKTTKQV